MDVELEESLHDMCNSMRKQLVYRSFYAWLSYTKYIKSVRRQLVHLVNLPSMDCEGEIHSTLDTKLEEGLTDQFWRLLHNENDGSIDPKFTKDIYRLLYFGGCTHEIRREVWLYLLKHWTFGMTVEERKKKNEDTKKHYEVAMSEWLALEAIVRQRDKEITAANLAKFSSESTASSDGYNMVNSAGQEIKQMSNDVFDESTSNSPSSLASKTRRLFKMIRQRAIQSRGSQVVEDVPGESPVRNVASTDRNGPTTDSSRTSSIRKVVSADYNRKVNTSCRGVLMNGSCIRGKDNPSDSIDDLKEEMEESFVQNDTREIDDKDSDSQESNGTPTHCCPTPSSTSSNGGGGSFTYSTDLTDSFSLNLHQIEKDVRRCDRNYPFYMEKDNLDKLRNVMCTYVWENLENGYFQGMCDLVAPLLVIFDDESLTYSCFIELMKRMITNFPSGGTMSTLFVNLRSLIQVLDSEVFQLMHANGDYTHFYFCYRWFLLDFKRELLYDDVFRVWEAIWSSKNVSTPEFGLFIAAAFIETYRDVIISSNMDFADIIKFFNGMAEKHDAQTILATARNLVQQVQTLVQDGSDSSHHSLFDR